MNLDFVNRVLVGLIVLADPANWSQPLADASREAFSETQAVSSVTLLAADKRLPLFAKVLDVHRKRCRFAFPEVEKEVQLSW